MRIDPFSGGNQLISELPPEEIRDFLDNTYADYDKYKEKLGLNVIVSYYLLIKSSPSFTKVRAVLIAVKLAIKAVWPLWRPLASAVIYRK